MYSRGTDPNRTGPRGIPVLVHAIVSHIAKDTSWVELLFAYGANLESEFLFKPLAPRVPQAELMTTFLLAKGLDLNSTHAKWGTPLHRAIYSARPNLVKLLLHAGADRTARSPGTQYHGKTPSEAAETVRNPNTRQAIPDLLQT